MATDEMFQIRGDKLLDFIQSLLIINLLDRPDMLREQTEDGLKIANLVIARKGWDDPTLGGFFPIPPALVTMLNGFKLFLLNNKGLLAGMNLNALGLLNTLAYPTYEEIEGSVQRVTDVEPLIRFFGQFI